MEYIHFTSRMQHFHTAIFIISHMVNATHYIKMYTKSGISYYSAGPLFLQLACVWQITHQSIGTVLYASQVWKRPEAWNRRKGHSYFMSSDTLWKPSILTPR